MNHVLVHVLLISLNMVRQGGSLRGCHGDPRVIGEQTSKEKRAPGREKRIFLPKKRPLEPGQRTGVLDETRVERSEQKHVSKHTPEEVTQHIS